VAIVSPALLLGAAVAIGAVAGPVGVAAGLLICALPALVLGRAFAAARPYPTSPRGLMIFLVDHTWSLVNTLAGAVFLTVAQRAGNRIDPDWSRGSGTVHLAAGVFPGYLTTIGTVIAGIDPPVHRHEQGHVFQARLFGPFYLPLVAANYVLATVLPYWWPFHDRVKYPITDLRSYLQRGVYPHVWHEAWCYRVYGPPR
jgi:hypothetical protein